MPLFFGLLKMKFILAAAAFFMSVASGAAQPIDIFDSGITAGGDLNSYSLVKSLSNAEDDIPDYSGFYQGKFELKNTFSYQQVNCNGTADYSAEFFVDQQGNQIVISTPGGAQLLGRARNRIFRARVVLQDGNLLRKIRILGRKIDTTSARIRMRERVFSQKIRLCQFSYRALMSRMGKL